MSPVESHRTFRRIPQGVSRRRFLRDVGAGMASTLMATRAGAVTPLPSLRDRLGVTTEEISEDLATALTFVTSFGLRWVEIRKLGGIYATELPLPEIKRARALLDAHKVRLSVFDTALFKCDLPGLTSGRKDEFPFAAQEGLLDRALERAPLLGSRYLRIFTFWRAGDPAAAFAQALPYLRKACDKARAAGLTLLVENLAGANVATSADAARLLAAVPTPTLGLAWDPNNAYCADEAAPFPAGLAQLDQRRIHHIHLRDAAWVEGDPAVSPRACRWLPVGKGKIDNAGLLRALAQRGYAGTLSLETHYQRPDKNKALASRESLEGLLALLPR
jgi:sugar phosphate isomerase/epimerase